MNVSFNVLLTKETPWYVAKCIDNSVASQGKSVEEALENLKEALELFYEGECSTEGALFPEQKQAFLTTVGVALP